MENRNFFYKDKTCFNKKQHAFEITTTTQSHFFLKIKKTQKKSLTTKKTLLNSKSSENENSVLNQNQSNTPPPIKPTTTIKTTKPNQTKMTLKEIKLLKSTDNKSTKILNNDESFATATRLYSNLNPKTLKHEPGNILGSASLVAGTTVGAGILALPAITEVLFLLLI